MTLTDALTWIAESGERLTVVGLLLIIVFVVVYGVQKKQRWWVPGWMYSECQDEVTRLEAKLQEHTDRIQRRLDIMEELEDERMKTRKRV